MNEEIGWFNFQKQIYGKFFGKNFFIKVMVVCSAKLRTAFFFWSICSGNFALFF